MEKDEDEGLEGRPLTPNQQLTLIKLIAMERAYLYTEPTEKDLQVEMSYVALKQVLRILLLSYQKTAWLAQAKSSLLLV